MYNLQKPLITQSDVVKRTCEIVKEFNSRVTVIGIMSAVVELAKALAENESEKEIIIGLEPGTHKVQCEHCGEFTEFEVPNPVEK